MPDGDEIINEDGDVLLDSNGDVILDSDDCDNCGCPDSPACPDCTQTLPACGCTPMCCSALIENHVVCEGCQSFPYVPNPDLRQFRVAGSADGSICLSVNADCHSWGVNLADAALTYDDYSFLPDCAEPTETAQTVESYMIVYVFGGTVYAWIQAGHLAQEHVVFYLYGSAPFVDYSTPVTIAATGGCGVAVNMPAVGLAYQFFESATVTVSWCDCDCNSGKCRYRWTSDYDCATAQWSVPALDSSQCSYAYGTADEWHAGPDFPLTAIKHTLGPVRQCSGGPCPTPQTPDPPEYTPDCNCRCRYHWTVEYDCLNVEWGTVTLGGTTCAPGVTASGWAPVLGETLIFECDTIADEAGCTCTDGGSCPADPEPPPHPDTTPSNGVTQFVWESSFNCLDPEAGWSEPVVSDYTCVLSVIETEWAFDRVGDSSTVIYSRVTQGANCPCLGSAGVPAETAIDPPIGPATECSAECPESCGDCSATYTFTVSGSGGAVLDGTSTYTQVGSTCEWDIGGGLGGSIVCTDGQWIMGKNDNGVHINIWTAPITAGPPNCPPSDPADWFLAEGSGTLS